MLFMKLADYLAQHKISQAALAAHLKVSQGRVWQWLNGERVTPKYCPEIEVWSNREVTCEELNATVNWKYVRESAESLAESEKPNGIVDRAAASDDTQPPVGGESSKGGGPG